MALQLWVEFFDDLQNIRGRSRNTVMAYRRDLELYDEYQKRGGSLTGFYQFMKDGGLSTRSQARVISSLRTYFRFLEKNDVPAPELRELQPPKVKVNLPQALKPRDFDRLVEACQVDDPYRHFRNHLTLLLLFGLGCRVSELISLSLKDYHPSDSWLRVMGKAGKERLLPLTEGLRQALDRYLTDVRPEIVKTSTSSILINDRGNRPSRVDIWRWLAAWSEKAGFENTINPHRFRHGCATALLESGADLRSIQVLLGHASLQTTQIYTSVTNTHLKKEIEEKHPLSELKDLDS